uniref:Uncharacterized protein n=1 Tax=Ananas comosus var. bracteatus TaxID=296719 RepID=A0A6V7PNM7_ANACO|nr:unnamed protein product [Ananas comosus var. bracteatus]
MSKIPYDSKAVVYYSIRVFEAILRYLKSTTNIRIFYLADFDNGEVKDRYRERDGELPSGGGGGAAAVIEHRREVERVYWTVAASDVMTANPGHYVAVVVVAAPRSSASGNSSSSASSDGDGRSRAAPPVAHVKLLRPDDPLHLGRVYRLVAFEVALLYIFYCLVWYHVLKVFGSRRHVKLSKLIARQERKKKAKLQESNEGGGNASNESSSKTKMEIEKQEDKSFELESDVSGDVMTTYKLSKCGLWRPTLQSIAEGRVRSICSSTSTCE